MTVLLARLLLIAVCAALGFVSTAMLGVGPLAGVALGAAAAGVAIGAEIALRRVAPASLLWVGGGAGAGLVLGLALGTALGPLAGQAAPTVRSVTALLGAWVGGTVAARRASELRLRPALDSAPSMLDTSVIVDGRIADIVEAGFLDGAVIVPRFVVREVQRLADSGDALRRGRGRRGFDVLDRLRRSPGIRLELCGSDVPDEDQVDGKLVALARARGARLLTNDAALGHIATLAGVAVGNVNTLAAALRPVTLPGESLSVQLVRQGKEPGQGVAYLEDGTMVVVEGGKRFLGQPLDVVVTSVLQTSAGRMVFARPRGDDGGRDA